MPCQFSVINRISVVYYKTFSESWSQKSLIPDRDIHHANVFMLILWIHISDYYIHHKAAAIFDE